KGYLLAPRRFLTLNTLLDTVLEADGISREVVEAQRARVDLIGQLADAFEQGEDQLTKAVEQHKDKLDYEFFATLTAFAEASAQSGNAESSDLLVSLRDKLIELTGFDASELGEFADEDFAIDEVIERLANAADGQELEQAIAEMRPAIDYGFFEEWTKRIDAAEQAGDIAAAERLSARRSQILETVERMDKQAQELFEAGATVLQAAMEAEDTAAALRAQSDKLDEAFLLVLEANLAAAQRAGATEAVAKLEEIRSLALQIVQESLSPEERFINELLSAEKPQDATKLLRQNVAIITPAFVKRLNELADQFEGDGRKPLGERLRQLGREAGAMLF
ncbi:MAG TPA: hypothetical protein VFX76_14335, partial [Roseiflexaceae bacterium]|nr:hypothetical protein [Roseiflexaceae bacterium]